MDAAISLKKLDELFLKQHSYLTNDDHCYYLCEYTANKGAQYSSSNSLIYNFKKSVTHKDTKLWQYKQEAINNIAHAFKNCFFRNETIKQRLEKATLIPIPSSKTKQNPMYDNRMLKLLQALNGETNELDIREFILTKKDRPSQSSQTTRLNPMQLLDYLQIDITLEKPIPKEIWLFDDVITTGSTFKACCRLLQKIYPNVPALGFFIARRNIPLEEDE